MPRKGFKDTKTFAVACSMPAGKRHQPNEQFSWADSEVAQWLLSQDEIASYLFAKAKEAGAIIYDSETGTWRGRDSSS